MAALPQSSRRRFLASCQRVELRFAEVLGGPGERIRYVYFPIDSCISLVTMLDDGARLEVGLVGNEGMLGTSIALGVSESPQHAVVQGAGAALRMSAAAFARHCRQSTELRRMLMRYVYVLMRELAQTAACNHYHLIEARLAGWLLMTRDRVHGDRFLLTHKFLAYMLGVRRVGVTQAAGSLQEQGLIDYRRGTIAILDGARLEQASCGCYRRGKEMQEQILREPRAIYGRRRASSKKLTAANAG